MKHSSSQLSYCLQLLLKLLTKCYMNSQPWRISYLIVLQNQGKYRQLFAQQRPMMFRQFVTAGKSSPKTFRILQRSERFKECDRSDFDCLYAAILSKTSTMDGSLIRQDLTAMVISVIQLRSPCSTLPRHGISKDSKTARISILQWLFLNTWRMMVKVLMMAAAVDAFGSCAMTAEKVEVRASGSAKMRLQQS